MPAKSQYLYIYRMYYIIIYSTVQPTVSLFSFKFKLNQNEIKKNQKKI